MRKKASQFRYFKVYSLKIKKCTCSILFFLWFSRLSDDDKLCHFLYVTIIFIILLITYTLHNIFISSPFRIQLHSLVAHLINSYSFVLKATPMMYICKLRKK